MMDSTNFAQALERMGFSREGDVYEKKFPEFGCSLRVDFGQRKLIYPEAIRGRERNDTFDQQENFVVFECVHRLLEKGYRPEHIELEKQWPLGHDSKGGRADICVYAPDGTMLFIIECKVAGPKFDKAYRDTRNDGAQLFSYWQQEPAAQWLVLYTSDLTEANITHKAPVIHCVDDPNIVDMARKDKTIRLYSAAHTAPEKHAVWKETYLCKFHDDLIFSSESKAYEIGIPPLYKRNLKDFKPEDRIVNQFEEILRHNNVSDKENAFNRLVALFICKLVDEITKGEDDEVEFQYKQGTDTYETLQDRLLRLHQEGMEKFMRERIFYVPADYPEQLFATFTGHRREKAIEDLKEKIRILKFYSNNDFSFKNVHNEELFYQNGKILVEVVQLFERYRIVYPSKHQFLGDLFEKLLNKGFKQNEGQFFTPMPITRFVWDCLPLGRLTHTQEGFHYPRVVDYACGAGHFLTEAVEAINAASGQNGGNDWAREHIFGIEKDYRLARVAKISLYMNGAGEGNIIFGDGLENTPERQIENGSFDILVANPPYSVKDFKQHLKLKNNTFTLLDTIGENGSEIETLFIERICQLLKPAGVAAVILPSSILSNDSASYSGARALLLQNFYLRGIVQLGSKTFGATGTNTVILFLEKFREPPKRRDLAQDSVAAILSGQALEGWQDQDILKGYVGRIGVEEERYIGFARQTAPVEELAQDAYLGRYAEAFERDSEILRYRNSKTFQKLTAQEQKRLLDERFYRYVKKVEFQKLMGYALTWEQKTVIITAPADNAKQKEFLGYDWSSRKGSEGIQELTPGGKLYRDDDRNAEGTLAHLIRQSFAGRYPELSEENRQYARVANTADMLDFTRAGFNSVLRTGPRKNRGISSRYPLHRLGRKCHVVIGGTPERAKRAYYTGENLWVSIGEMNGQVITDTKEKITDAAVENSNVKRIPQGTTLLSFKLSIGKTAIAGRDLYTNEAIAGLIPIDGEEVLDGYLFHLFHSRLIDLENVGDKAFGKSLNSAYLREEVHIPVPPKPVQEQLIRACEALAQEYASTRMRQETYQKRIEALFHELGVILSNRDQDAEA